MKDAKRPGPDAHPFGASDIEPVPATRRERFRFWFSNVFWYHYKWRLIIGAAVLATVGFFVRDMLVQTTPDFQFVVASDSFVSNDSISELTGIASDVFSGFGSGASADCLGHGLHTSVEGQFGMAALTRLATLIVDDSISFYIFDAYLLEAFFDEPSVFYDLEGLGFNVVPGKPWLADVSGSPLLDRIGLSGVTSYAVIQRPHNEQTVSRAPDPRYLAFLEAIFNTP